MTFHPCRPRHIAGVNGLHPQATIAGYMTKTTLYGLIDNETGTKHGTIELGFVRPGFWNHCDIAETL